MSQKQQRVKEPVQLRSLVRYEKILKAAESLILEVGIDETSSHKIALRAGIPAASVYQYFPTKYSIFQCLADQHFLKVNKLFETELEKSKIHHWKDLAKLLVDVSYNFYTSDPIAEVLFLSVHSITNVRKGAASRLSEFGHWYASIFEKYVTASDIEDLPEIIAISVNIVDASFTRSLSLHGKITHRYYEEANRALVGYLATYFPD